MKKVVEPQRFVRTSCVAAYKFIQLVAGDPFLGFKAMGIDIHGGGAAGVAQIF